MQYEYDKLCGRIYVPSIEEINIQYWYNAHDSISILWQYIQVDFKLNWIIIIYCIINTIKLKFTSIEIKSV